MDHSVKAMSGHRKMRFSRLLNRHRFENDELEGLFQRYIFKLQHSSIREEGGDQGGLMELFRGNQGDIQQIFCCQCFGRRIGPSFGQGQIENGIHFVSFTRDDLNLPLVTVSLSPLVPLENT